MQVFVALAALLLLGAVDFALLREPPEPRASAEGLQGDIVWPERAYRALVVGLAADPANPFGFTPRERRDAHRWIRAMEREGRTVLWAVTRLQDLLDEPQLAEFAALQSDLRARALILRLPVPLLAEDAVDALKARSGGRVAEPRPVPADWDPDRDELEAWRRWRERTASWSAEGLLERLEGEAAAERPSADMLDFPPREVLTVLVRLQADPARALQGDQAAEAAGYARMVGRAERAMDSAWEGLHGMTLADARAALKRTRKLADPDAEDPSFPALLEAYARALAP